jgi:Rrf2 family protein
MAANSRFAMATHMMTALALNEDELLTSTYLADSLNTNPVVVRRILADLQKAGLLETHTGRSGGARLARKAKDITLYEVYAAVDEGELFAYNPNDPNKKCPLSCEMKSVLEPIFATVQASLATSLKDVRLSEVVGKIAKRCSLAKDTVSRT